MTFQLDTSGHVEMGRKDGKAWVVTWDDLSPFTQGYIEALFASVGGFEAIRADDLAWPGKTSFKGFSDLTPETLARIVADCERFRAIGEREGFNNSDDTAEHGGRFWQARNSKPWPSHPPIYERDGFPPLTVQLGDDGKVRFA